jgi:hypothetical protein
VQRTSPREPLESLGFSALADRRHTRKPTRNEDDDSVTDIIAVTDLPMEAWYDPCETPSGFGFPAINSENSQR